MFRELWDFIRIEYLIIRELNLRLKLLKHQCKMVDTWTDIDHELSGKKFMIKGVQDEFDRLRSRIKSRFS